MIIIHAHNRLRLAVLRILERIEPRLSPPDAVALERVDWMVAFLERPQIPDSARHHATIGRLAEIVVDAAVELGVVQVPLRWAPVDRHIGVQARCQMQTDVKHGVVVVPDRLCGDGLWNVQPRIVHLEGCGVEIRGFVPACP